MKLEDLSIREQQLFRGECPPDNPCRPEDRAAFRAYYDAIFAGKAKDEAAALAEASLQQDEVVLYVTVQVLRGSCPSLDGAIIRLLFTPAARLADYGLESFPAGEAGPAWVGEVDYPGHSRVPFGLLRTGDGPAKYQSAFNRRPQLGPTTGHRVPLMLRMTSPVFPAGIWGCAGDVQLKFTVTV